MNEKELEQKIDEAADKFEKTMIKKWNTRSFRYALKAVALIAEAGIIATAFCLKNSGYEKAAIICFVLGVVGVGADIITSISFKKHRKQEGIKWEQ